MKKGVKKEEGNKKNPFDAVYLYFEDVLLVLKDDSSVGFSQWNRLKGVFFMDLSYT